MSENEPWEGDVLVIGAGPAGSSAALAAAREGARVLVVERRRTIGVPVQCAEYIPAMLLAGDLPVDRRVVVQSVSTLRTWRPGCPSQDLPAPGFTICRDLFDQQLADAARRAGAVYRTSMAAAERLDARTVMLAPRNGGTRLTAKARIIVGADGPHSISARWAGGQTPRLLPGIQARVVLTRPMEAAEVFLEPAIRAGYAWLFPKGREANAGLAFKADAGATPPPRRLLDDFLRRLRAEGRIEGPVLCWQAGWVPVSAAAGTVSGNLLLVGDAAGQTHPITGAGIFSAVTCGAMAGRWAARAALAGEDGRLKGYEEEWCDLLGQTLSRAARRRRFMEDNWERFGEIITSCWVAYREYYAESAGDGEPDAAAGSRQAQQLG